MFNCDRNGAMHLSTRQQLRENYRYANLQGNK